MSIAARDAFRDSLVRSTGAAPASLADDVLIAELAPDSFAMVEILLALQDDLGVVVSARDLDGVRTLGDLRARVVPRDRATH